MVSTDSVNYTSLLLSCIAGHYGSKWYTQRELEGKLRSIDGGLDGRKTMFLLNVSTVRDVFNIVFNLFRRPCNRIQSSPGCDRDPRSTSKAPTLPNDTIFRLLDRFLVLSFFPIISPVIHGWADAGVGIGILG